MTLKNLNRLTFVGFGLIYFAAMGSLITIIMPFFETIKPTVLCFVMLPAGLIGVVLIAIERLHGPASDEGSWKSLDNALR